MLIYVTARTEGSKISISFGGVVVKSRSVPLNAITDVTASHANSPENTIIIELIFFFELYSSFVKA
jgi:hypothetical protein